jgi:cytochrome c553
MTKSKLAVIAVAGAFALGVVSAVSAADVKANYDKMCAACHGKDGEGKAAMKTKDYTDAKVQAEMKDDEMIKAIKDGVPNSKMKKGYSDKLSDQEIKDLTALVRSFKK